MKSFIPFFIVAICVGMYFVYISPTIADINIKKERNSEYENVLNQVKELKQRRDTLSTLYNSILDEDMAKLNKIIPGKFDPVYFSNDLNSISSKYGMLIKNVRIAYSSPRGDSVDPEVTEKGYKTIGIEISLSGRYDQFLSFLRDLETSLQLMDVVNLSVKSGSVRRGEDINLEYSLRINTYALE
ncbi:MAG: GspMb/PilO family protein [Minisyncoccia bacterium]